MTRRTRRRATVLLFAAVAGAGSPLWGPPLLRTLPAFEVDRVEVAGARLADPAEVRTLAAIPAGASVWDDPSGWEARVRSHRLVEDVRIDRSGWGTLEIRLSEVEPVALLAAGGALRPVDRRGVVLPVDPTRKPVDLPVLRGEPEVEGGRVRSPEMLREIAVVWELGRRDSAFMERVSQVESLPGRGLRMWMMEEAPVEQVLLPVEDPRRALSRVEVALGLAGMTARTADARFRDQVVLRTTEVEE